MLFLRVLAALAATAPAAASGYRPVSSIAQSDWDAFNASISGRLKIGIPMLAPCYATLNGEHKTIDTRECTILDRNRGNHSFVSEHFGGYAESNWGGCQATGENCALNKIIPDNETALVRTCEQGSVPGRYVNASGVEHVQRTLSFAREMGVRLVVKNTGHDYLGRSSGADSLGLWTHHIQPRMKLVKAFTPKKCSETVGDVITVGAGQEFGKVYSFAYARGYRVVGGTSPSVGIAGGWLAAGGHSMLSNELGMGVDNVQEVKAVLPNGTYTTANRCQNQDIFFALRGGGGGTFGVVTEISYSVHPKKPMQFAMITIDGVDEDVVAEILEISVANADKWASEGWGGYIVPAAVGDPSVVAMGTTMLDLAKAKSSMQPFIDLANRRAGPGTLGNATVSTSDYHRVLQAIMTRNSARVLPSTGFALSSRIIPRETFSDSSKQLASTLHDLLNAFKKERLPVTSNFLLQAVTPSLYSRTMPESDLPGNPGASSITPAWRTGLWHAISSQQFDGTTTDPDVIQRIWQATHDAMNPLRELTPDGGAYQNEADPFEPNAVHSFWGKDNYDRLLQIKREVDPTNLLTVHGGIGWNWEDERYSCYPDVKESSGIPKSSVESRDEL